MLKDHARTQSLKSHYKSGIMNISLPALRDLKSIAFPTGGTPSPGPFLVNITSGVTSTTAPGEGGRHSHGIVCVISATLDDWVSIPSRGGGVSDEPRPLVFALRRGLQCVVNNPSSA